MKSKLTFTSTSSEYTHRVYSAVFVLHLIGKWAKDLIKQPHVIYFTGNLDICINWSFTHIYFRNCINHCFRVYWKFVCYNFSSTALKHWFWKRTTSQQSTEVLFVCFLLFFNPVYAILKCTSWNPPSEDFLGYFSIHFSICCCCKTILLQVL